MTLVALKAFPYASQSIAVGEVFEASDSDARVLLAAHLAVVEAVLDPMQIQEWDGIVPPRRRGRPRKTVE